MPFFRSSSIMLYRFIVPGVLVCWLAGCATTLAPSGGASVSTRLVASEFVVDGPAPDHVTRAKQLFVRGLTQAYLEKHREAIGLFEESLRLVPNNAAVLSAISQSKEAMGQYADALFYAEQARQYDPENVHYHRQLAHLYLSSGDTRQAAGAYETLLRQFPNDPEALYGLARVHSVSGRYEDAVQAYERLIERNGDDPDVRTEMLQIFVRQGDEVGMERTLRRLVELQPDETRFRRMLGELLIQQQREAEALRLYEQAIESNPADFDAVMTLAELYRRTGDDDKADALMQASAPLETVSVPQLLARAAALYGRADRDADAAATAEELLRHALERAPDHADALVMLGDLRLRAEAFTEAADLLYRAVQVNPRDPMLWHQAAAAYLQAGAAARAADVADEGLLLFPGQLHLLRISGYALMDANRNQASIARFEEALDVLAEDAPDDLTQRGDLLSALGLLYSRTNDTAASDRSYRAAIEADPENHLALNNYAYSLAERGVELQQALELARKAVALHPDEPSYLDTLGWIYFKLDRLTQAREWIGKAVATGSAGAAVLEHYGDVLSRLGERAEARRHWQRALDLRPGNAQLRQKLEAAGQ